MGSEVMLGGFGQPDERRGLAARPSRGQRAAQRRTDVDLVRLHGAGKIEEVKLLLRKRMTEDGMHDVADIFQLGQQLAAENPAVASLLGDIVREFAYTTARDIRDFGRMRGM